MIKRKRLVWKLRAFLEAHGKSAYQLDLKVRLGGEGYSPSTVYGWVRSKNPPARIHSDTLERILIALEKVIEDNVSLTDILDWEEVIDEEDMQEPKVPVAKAPRAKKGAKPKTGAVKS